MSAHLCLVVCWKLEQLSPSCFPGEHPEAAEHGGLAQAAGQAGAAAERGAAGRAGKREWNSGTNPLQRDALSLTGVFPSLLTLGECHHAGTHLDGNPN